MPSKNKRLNNIAQKQGNSSWRTALPLKQLGFWLSKAQFWGAVYLRYWLPLKRLPRHCDCSKFYTVQRALFCKKPLTWKCRWNVTGNQQQCQNRADVITSNWRITINRWKCISGNTSWYQRKRVLVSCKEINQKMNLVW